MAYRVKVRITAGPLVIDEVFVVKDVNDYKILENVEERESFSVLSVEEETPPIPMTASEAILKIREIIEAAGGR